MFTSPPGQEMLHRHRLRMPAMVCFTGLVFRNAPVSAIVHHVVTPGPALLFGLRGQAFMFRATRAYRRASVKLSIQPSTDTTSSCANSRFMTRCSVAAVISGDSFSGA